jgi:hypothetical protein
MILEGGMIPISSWYFYEEPVPKHVTFPVPIYTELSAEAIFCEHLFVGGSARTDMFTKEDGFSPHWLLWEFWAGIRFSVIEVGFRHSCSHPFQGYIWTPANRDFQPLLEGAYEEVYLRVTVEWESEKRNRQRF